MKAGDRGECPSASSSALPDRSAAGIRQALHRFPPATRHTAPHHRGVPDSKGEVEGAAAQGRAAEAKRAFLCGAARGDALTPLLLSLRRSYQLAAPAGMTGTTRRLPLPSGGAGPGTPAGAEKNVEDDDRLTGVEPDEDAKIRAYLTQAALLLSVEEARANVEATQLFLTCPDTRRLLLDIQWRKPVTPPSMLPLPLTGTSQPRTAAGPLFPLQALRFLLDPHTVASMVRSQLRENQTQWAQALQWLEATALTPVTAATRIDLCRKLGHWSAALESLTAVPPSSWTEMDVSGTIQALYEAARREQRAAQGGKEGGTVDSPPACGAVEEGSAAAATAEEHLAGPSPSPSSTTRSGWILLLCEAASRILRCGSHHVERWSSPAALNNALALFAFAPQQQWREASELLGCALHTTTNRHLTGASLEEETEAEEPLAPSDASLDAAATATLMDWRRPPLSYRPMPGLRPNRVTLFHTSQLFQQQWEVGLGFALAMLNEHPIPVGGDLNTVERLLQLCVDGQRWREALDLMERSNAYGAAASRADGKGATRYGCSLSPQRRRLRASLQGPLASLLCQHVQPEQASSTVFHSSSALSKYFNHNTLSRAYNSLIQQCTTVEDGEHYINELRRLHGAVENESVAHLVTLYGKEGQWVKALSSFRSLLDDPQRRPHYLPTAALHDTVQYALEQAPAPGASWEVSVRLFTDLTGNRQVPLSDVAFQSVVKKCFSQGASVQAQRLFEYLIRHGVR